MEEDPSNTVSPISNPTMPSSPVENTARHHRRSRILSTLNVGRMRHATPEERLAALRDLRSVDRDPATDANQEQGGWMVGERTMGRFSRRFSRAFGGGHDSRRSSQVVVPASDLISDPSQTTTEHATAPMPAVDTHAPEILGEDTHTGEAASVIR